MFTFVSTELRRRHITLFEIWKYDFSIYLASNVSESRDVEILSSTKVSEVSSEESMKKKGQLEERAALVQRVLQVFYPNPPVPLNHFDSFSLLVAVSGVPKSTVIQYIADISIPIFRNVIFVFEVFCWRSLKVSLT